MILRAILLAEATPAGSIAPERPGHHAFRH